MTKDEALKMALGSMSGRYCNLHKEAIAAIKEVLAQPEHSCVACEGNPKGNNNPCAVCGLAQPEQEPVTIWYMRDNHTFKKLSADVSTALIEIEQEFNEGYTYGMLCSKRKGFPTVHASGDKKRLEFFAECKSTLEQWLPTQPSTPPQRKSLTDEQWQVIADTLDCLITRKQKDAIEAVIGIKE